MNGPITSEGMGFFHNDTYGIALQFPLSIPTVSDNQGALPYYSLMEKDDWKTWGPRFKALAKENGETLATVAEKMGLAESTLRSWTNGTHDVNLADVMEMCAHADVNPALVLFNAPLMRPEIKSQLRDLAKNVFDADHSIVPGYQKQAKPPRTKPRQRA